MIDVIVRAANDVGFQPKVAYGANDYQEVQDIHPAGAEIAMTVMLVEAAGDFTLVSHR